MKKLILFCLLSIFFLQEPAFSAFNFIDNGNGTVTDARTGLVWLKNANPCGQKNWYDAGTYCASLANGQAGLTDGSTAGQWRLPNKEELEGIGTDPPAIWEGPGLPSVTWTRPGAPFTNVQEGPANYYWSGTTFPFPPYYPDYAWNVRMGNGDVSDDSKGPNDLYDVWAVREPITTTPTIIPAPVPKTGQTISYATGDDGALQKGVISPVPRFSDNNDGTVTDKLTGLIWLKNANPCGTKNWFDAVAYCNSLASGTAGLTDGSVAGAWRLPNVKELHSLIDYGRYNPALPAGHPFTGVQSDYYWSGTSSAASADDALSVAMNYGYTNGTPIKSDPSYFVWAVRGPVTPSPTNIKLSALEAVPSNKQVILKWKTETETDNAGFNIWRAEGFQKVNDSVIPALGSSVEGSDYDFVDEWVLNSKRYFYLLEDIDTNGISTFHGPVKAVPRWFYGARR